MESSTNGSRECCAKAEKEVNVCVETMPTLSGGQKWVHTTNICKPNYGWWEMDSGGGWVSECMLKSSK